MIGWYIELALYIALYMEFGRIFHKAVKEHIMDLEEKVNRIDPRYANQLWIYIGFEKPDPWKIKCLNIVLWIFWPVCCMAAMYKAEDAYSIIRHHYLNRGARV